MASNQTGAVALEQNHAQDHRHKQGTHGGASPSGCSCCQESSMADILALNDSGHRHKHEHAHAHAHDHACCGGEHEHTHDHGAAESGGCSCCAESSMADILALNEEHDHGHDHGHHHDHAHAGAHLAPLAISMLLFLLATVVQYRGSDAIANRERIAIGMYLAAWLISGWETLRGAVRNILKGQLFDEGFLMSLATVGAIAIREYPEAAAVMMFYQAGEYLQSLAVGRSKKSIAEMMNIRPDFANLVGADGSMTVVAPEVLKVGDRIAIKPGERIPVDCTILSGTTAIDNRALTGESIPAERGVGEQVLSGSINLTGVVQARVDQIFAESTVSKILTLVQSAGAKKSEQEKLITRFSKIYTPIVVLLAALLAILPPMILGDSFAKWFERALIFLVVSCPCALVISVPLSFFAGIGGASKRGILFKGSRYIEALSQVQRVMLDKTGTITKGVFEVTQVEGFGATREEVLELAAYAEHSSNHPIAKSIVKAYQRETARALDAQRIRSIEEQSGFGMVATLADAVVLAGNHRLMEAHGIDAPTEESGTVVYIAKDGTLKGIIRIEDQIKPEAKRAIEQLKVRGIDSVMLTGDLPEAAERIAHEAGVSDFRAQLLPQDKVAAVEEALLQYQNAKHKTVAFVGDGINDAPVLARADVGIAMGGVGSDAAIEAADIVLMTDELTKLEEAIQIAKNTMRTAKQNITFALGIKIIVMLLGTIGMANMWMAVFADVGVALIAVANAMRAMNTGKWNAA